MTRFTTFFTIYQSGRLWVVWEKDDISGELIHIKVIVYHSQESQLIM